MTQFPWFQKLRSYPKESRKIANKVEKTPLQQVGSVDHVIPFVCFPIKFTVTVKVVCKTKTKPIRLNTKNWNVKK